MRDGSERSQAWRDEIRRRLEPLQLSATREAEIVEELAQHLEDRYRELRASGATEPDADAAALGEIDEADVLRREVARLERPAPLDLPPPGAPARARWVGALWQDIRYAARTLRKSPGFTFTVLLALALSIGPTTAIVSIGNWLLWRPHPGVTDSDRLAVMWVGNWRENGSMSPASLNYQHLGDLAGGSKLASGITGGQETSSSLSISGTPPRRIGTAHVTANFFDVLGVRMRAGRGFLPEEDSGAGVPVAIVSEGLARSTFGASESALDRTIHLNSRPFTIVGIAPASFAGTSPAGSIDVWIPGAAYGYMNHFRVVRPPSFYSFIVRIAPGATFGALERELNALIGGLVEAQPQENRRLATAAARIFPGLGVEPLIRPRTRRMVMTMLAVGAVLLLLGCANVANLLVFRTTRREHEIAVRKALGATRARLVQVQLMEGCMLAVCGAALGLGLALFLKQLMQQLMFPRPPGMSVNVPIDDRVLVATIIAALATGVLSAAGPAWLAARGATASVSRGGTRSSTRVPKLRGGLAALQLALSLTLLVGALLLVTTLRNLRSVDLGFDPSRVTAMSVDLASHGFAQDRALQYYRDVLPALEARGEFEAVSLAGEVPFASGSNVRVLPPGGNVAKPLEIGASGVTHNYFNLLSIPLVRGRAFTAEESFAAGVNPPVVINEALAMRLYGTVDVVGRTVHFPRTASNPARDLVIIGVARDSRMGDITGELEPFIYQPLGRFDFRATRAEFMIRSRLPVRKVGELANAISSRLNGSVPLSAARPLTYGIDRALSQERLFAWVLSLLAGLGFVLASLGLYGLIAQTTTERRREFGIRLAIGATRADIVKLIGRYALTISAIGVIAGLALSFFGTRVVESMLFGVSRRQPAVYLAAVGTLVAVVVVACIVPALRALRVQPVEVLRAE